MDKTIAVLLGIAAIIKLMPVMGVLSAGRIAAMYDIAVAGPDLAILLRHRAVLFAIVGGLLATAVFRHELRGVAIVAGLVSAVSFIAIALVEGGYNSAMRRVLIADVVATMALVASAALLKIQHSN